MRDKLMFSKKVGSIPSTKAHNRVMYEAGEWQKTMRRLYKNESFSNLFGRINDHGHLALC